MAVNIFNQVVTYNKSELAYLQNTNVFVKKANKKFVEFEKIPKNLGDTVSFTKPFRFRSTNTLITTFQNTKQEVETLTISEQQSSSYAFTSSQFLLNAQQFMEEYGRGNVAEIATAIEANTGQVAVDSPFRFFGDGTSLLLNSFQSLAQAVSFFTNYGASKIDMTAVLPDVSIPQIIGSGLNQFVMNRNEKMANSWELGDFAGFEWSKSNLLPVHYSGTVGDQQLVLTLTAVNDPTGVAVTQLTFSGANVSDPNAFKAGDLISFDDGVGALPNLRYLTYTGHIVSANHVQCRVTADAGSDAGGIVVVDIYPPLCWDITSAQQNIPATTPLFSGTIRPYQIHAVRSHRAGLLWSGRALFLAMPRQTDLPPYPTASMVDQDTGVTLRSYHGATIYNGQLPQVGYTNDCIWGKKLVPEYGMRLCFPI